MASGVKVCEKTIEAYKSMKLSKKNRFMVMAIEDGKIIIDCEKEKNPDVNQEDEYKEFLSQLPPTVGRYCIVDLTIPQKNGSMKDCLFIITWCPDKASMKSNILYTTSKRELMDKIREGMIDIQANDLDDLDYSNLVERARR